MNDLHPWALDALRGERVTDDRTRREARRDWRIWGYGFVTGLSLSWPIGFIAGRVL